MLDLGGGGRSLAKRPVFPMTARSSTLMQPQHNNPLPAESLERKRAEKSLCKGFLALLFGPVWGREEPHSGWTPIWVVAFPERGRRGGTVGSWDEVPVPFGEARDANTSNHNLASQGSLSPCHRVTSTSTNIACYRPASFRRFFDALGSSINLARHFHLRTRSDPPTQRSEPPGNVKRWRINWS